MKTSRRENSLKQRGRRTRTKKISPFFCRIGKHVSPKFKACNISHVEWTDEISKCPIYCPSQEEFDDPIIYIQKIAPEAIKYGICKIVSPLKASVPAAEVLRDFTFSTYVQTLHHTQWDIDFSPGQRKYTYDAFKSMADACFTRQFPGCPSLEELEKTFWLAMYSRKQGTVEYAVNVDGTAFSADPEDLLGTSKWNLKTLPRLPNSVLHLVEHEIPGITCPMLYIGMLFSMFAWHVEDHFLYSINYHHAGAPKTWYGVPGHAALQFEKAYLDHAHAYDTLSDDEDEDGAFKKISEKTTMFPPNILMQHGVPVYKTVQMPGEFVITFPRAYHAGFSNGFNCGEAVNFAIANWFPFGAAAGRRYAALSMMAILPFEELLYKELGRFLEHECSDISSAELASHRFVKSSFLQHMQSVNNGLWCLNKSGVQNLVASSTLLQSSERTTICITCKRDCYLAFFECNTCYDLLCLFHGIESLDCQCGGKRKLFVREDLWSLEGIVRNLENEGVLQEVDAELKPGNDRIEIGDLQCGKRYAEETANSVTGEAAAEEQEIHAHENDEPKSSKRGLRELQGLLFFSSSKRTRGSCKLQ